MGFMCDVEGELLYAGGVAAHGSAANDAGLILDPHAVEAGKFDGGGIQRLVMEGSEETLASHPL